jgi:dihydrofolate synthase/folylpolyglutamate synthase
VTEQEALAYLSAAGRFGHLGLDRTERLLENLAHPERGMRFYHVAGTNGKGSTTASLDVMLRRLGRRTGRFISPHLIRPHERVAVDGVDISGTALVASTEEVWAAADGLPDPPTEFELWTGVALAHFRRQGVTDVAWETGLGGRWDSTNVVTPEVSVITSIGLDHMDRLGGTLAAIAGEKAGILKPGRPAVIGNLPQEALEVVERAAMEVGCDLWRVGREISVEDVTTSAGGTAFSYRDPYGGLSLETSLVGSHQAVNAALAVAALRRTAGPGTIAQAAAALREVRWPGRFEVLPGQPALVLDGAHNPQGAEALRAAWRAAFPGVRAVALFGCLSDRDPRDVAGVLSEEILTLHTVTPPSPRAREASETAALLGGIPHAEIGEGLLAARLDARRRGVPLLVFGSLYLIGAIEELLREAI